jgi:hypothetical protein
MQIEPLDSCAGIRTLVEATFLRVEGYECRCIDKFLDEIRTPSSPGTAPFGIRTGLHGPHCFGHFWDVWSTSGPRAEEGTGYELFLLDPHTLFLSFRNRYYLNPLGVNLGIVGALLPLSPEGPNSEDLAEAVRSLLREHRENTRAKAC